MRRKWLGSRKKSPRHSGGRKPRLDGCGSTSTQTTHATAPGYRGVDFHGRAPGKKPAGDSAKDQKPAGPFQKTPVCWPANSRPSIQNKGATVRRRKILRGMPEIERITKMDKATIRKLINNDGFPAAFVAGRWRAVEEDVIEYLRLKVDQNQKCKLGEDCEF